MVKTEPLFPSIKNFGTEYAENIVGVLKSENPNVVVIDSLVEYGNLSSNESVAAVDPFIFSVNEGLPDQSSLDLMLQINVADQVNGISLIPVHVSGSKLNIVQEIIKLVGNLISLVANFGKDSSVDIISDSADIIDDTIDSVDTAVGIKGTQRNMINNDSNPSNENIAVGSNTFNIKPDDMDSSTQKAKHVKSASYCYIGEDRGFRSCLQVEKGDKCMSGDIFPSKELCINPNLRQ